MRTFALLLSASLAACAVEADLPADDPGADATPADSPDVAYATRLTVQLTQSPPAVTNQSTATFAFTTSKPATTRCRINGGSYAACTSPVTFSNLLDGAHAFDLKATANGKTVAIPTYHWSVDTAAPLVTITSGPAGLTNQRSATFDFAASDTGTTTCALDGAAPVACSSPASYSGLADGSHSLVVRVTDAAGNVGSNARSWSVDGTLPALSMSYSCDSTTGLLDVAWTESDASGIISTTCSYGGTFWNCTGNTGWSGYLSGSKSPFTLTATDAAGNVRTTTKTINILACY